MENADSISESFQDGIVDAAVQFRILAVGHYVIIMHVISSNVKLGLILSAKSRKLVRVIIERGSCRDDYTFVN